MQFSSCFQRMAVQRLRMPSAERAGGGFPLQNPAWWFKPGQPTSPHAQVRIRKGDGPSGWGRSGFRISQCRTEPEPCLLSAASFYRLDTPRAAFFSFFLFSPRGPVRFALGAAFLRAARLTILRSCLSSILVVSATCNLFRCNLFRVSRNSGRCEVYVNRDYRSPESAAAAPGRLSAPAPHPIPAYNEDSHDPGLEKIARLRPSHRFRRAPQPTRQSPC